MSLDIAAVKAALVAYVTDTGLFTSVKQHEPLSTTTGLAAAVWWDSLAPATRQSGLASTSMRLAFTVRLYANWADGDGDQVDDMLVGAVDQLMAAWSGDFNLGGLVRCVDLLGSSGTALRAQGGYQRDQDGSTSYKRIATITLPLIVDDLYTQEA